MDKNTVIGFILIALTLFGFTFYQSARNRKYMEEQRRLDSIALANAPVDSLAAGAQVPDEPELLLESQPAPAIYRDSLLEQAHLAEGEVVTLENDLVKIDFTSKGAQPYSVQLKNYSSYGGGELFLFKEGGAEYAVSVYTGQYIRTSDFNFAVAEKSDSSVVFRLPFGDGGYIEQKYSLSPDGYNVSNLLSFVGMQNTIPRNVGSIDVDFSVNVPRLEKGYKNESQYSKLDYYFEG